MMRSRAAQTMHPLLLGWLVFALGFGPWACRLPGLASGADLALQRALGMSVCSTTQVAEGDRPIDAPGSQDHGTQACLACLSLASGPASASDLPAPRGSAELPPRWHASSLPAPLAQRPRQRGPPLRT